MSDVYIRIDARIDERYAERLERILEARGKFVMLYAKEKQWDIENLTMEQILEIRKQEGWKNPK
jgi:hypothetical protein